MFASVHFPIVDTRSFLSDSGRLSKPLWPIPSPDIEFVRSFGPVRHRPLGGMPGWIGEGEICDASNALRCEHSLRTQANNLSPSLPLRIVFRRFYFDGLASGKFEIGFATNPKYRSLHLNGDTVSGIITRLLNLPVRIPIPGSTDDKCVLIDAGPHIAASYLTATTKVSHYTETHQTWVRCGTPLVFLESSPFEALETPYFCRHIPLDNSLGLDLRHCLIPHPKRTMRMWRLSSAYRLISDWGMNRRANARRLRIYLQRLHCEHECLRLTLRNIMTKTLQVKPRSPSSDALQQYLNEATQRIGLLETKSKKHFEDSLLSAARESTNVIRPGELDALRRVLDTCDIRPNVRRKIDEYANNWSSVTLIEKQEVNYNMGDVFKDINSSIIATRGSIAEGVISLRSLGNNDVAEVIEQLDRLIESTADTDLSLEVKKECTELLDGITEQANKPDPSKSILKTLGESLFTILTKVAPIAKAANNCYDVLKKLWL